MTVAILRSLLLTTLMASMASAADTPPADALSAWAQARVAARESGAIVIARIDGNKVSVEGFGHRRWPDGPAPDGDTRFLIGSIGKVFTNLLLAEQVAKGALTYDQSLGSLLPDTVEPANPAVAEITLQAMATHHSGLPRLPPNFAPTDPADPYAGFDEAALWAGVAQARAGQPLDSYYGYSNFGTGLLGHLLGREAGSDYYRALAEQVIAPLAMTDTGKAAGDNHAEAVSGGQAARAWSNDDALAGAGGLWGSANDLSRLIQAYLGHRQHSLKHALSRDLDVVAPADHGMAVTRVWHVARAGGHPIYWHNGGTGTYWSFAGFRPDNGQGVVVLTSGDADPTVAAFAALGHVPDAPGTRPATKPDVDASVFGQYQLSDDFGIGVFERDGTLYAQASGQGALALHPLDDGWYALHEVDASLRFQREGDAVTGLTFVQGGASQHAARVAAAATRGQLAEVELPAEVYAQYVGRYVVAPGMEFSIRERSGGLEAMLTGQGWLPVYAAGDDRFFYRVVDASLQFSRDAEGRVDALTLHQGQIVQRAPRVDGAE